MHAAQDLMIAGRRFRDGRPGEEMTRTVSIAARGALMYWLLVMFLL
jgi:hypothetical protein